METTPDSPRPGLDSRTMALLQRIQEHGLAVINPKDIPDSELVSDEPPASAD